MWKWVETLNVQELSNECHNWRCTLGEICARIGLGPKYVESIVKCDRRQSIVSMCDTQTPDLFSATCA